MEFRKTTERDLAAVCDIYAFAKQSFAKAGIPQWQGAYPDAATVEGDIAQGIGYVLCDGDEVVGAVALTTKGEPGYNYIFDGDWLTTTALMSPFTASPCRARAGGRAFPSASCRRPRRWPHSLDFRLCGSTRTSKTPSCAQCLKVLDIRSAEPSSCSMGTKKARRACAMKNWSEESADLSAARPPHKTQKERGRGKRASGGRGGNRQTRRHAREKNTGRRSRLQDAARDCKKFKGAALGVGKARF